MPGDRVLGSVMAVAITVTVAACAPTGSQSVAPAPPSSSAVPASSAAPKPSPGADALRSAVSTTASLGSARLVITALTTVDGVDVELDGRGTAAFNTGDADISWDSSAGASREITSEGVGYVQVEPPDGEWITLDAGEQVPTLGAGQPLRALTDLAQVRDEGPEVLDGVPTTRVTGWLPAQGNLGGLGINDIDARGVTDDPSARILVTAWIDQSGRIVRVMRTLESTSGVAASTVTDLTDFGSPVEITAPR